MKYLRQLLRQPLKTFTGVALVTLAVAILCVSVGQAFAVRTTEENLHGQFTTVAMFTDMQTVSEDLSAWLEATAGERPDVVKEISKQGYLNAYIPGLFPLNYTDAENGAFFDTGNVGPTTVRPWPHGRPYSCAMLVVTIESVGGIVEKKRTFTVSEDLTLDDFATYDEYIAWYDLHHKNQSISYAFTVEIVARIDEVVSLSDGYADPTGRKLKLTFSSPTARGKEMTAISKLKKGGQYLVYGMDYRDRDFELRNGLKTSENGCVIEKDGVMSTATIELDSFDTANIHILTAEEKIEYEEKYLNSPSYSIVNGRVTLPYARYDVDSTTSVYLSESQYKNINLSTLTFGSPIGQLNYELIRERENGPVSEVKYITEYTYFDGEGYAVCTDKEYTEIYRIPTYALLSGTAEEFLNSENGAEWREALERDAINNSAFLTVSVDQLSYLIDFIREDSVITSGRAFSAEEFESGARVCVIHEALAAQNGIKVGDKITMNFYHTDKALPYDKKATGWGEYLTPAAAFYFDTTPIRETAEYTVVGLWRGETLWPDVRENEYAFSPNTVFIPNGSAETEAEHNESILYTTAVIHNGMLEEFRHLAEEAGYHDCFTYFDRGYTLIMRNFFNYENMALQVLTIGGTIYAVIVLLYLMLYPASYSKTVRTMESLGVSYPKRAVFVLKSSMSIVILSSVLGILIGTSLWGIAVSFLQSSANAGTSLFIEPGTLGNIAVAQFLFVLLLNVLVSLYVAVPRKMSARR